MPLIVGPAVLTTSLICIDSYGLFPTVFAVISNILIAGAVFLLFQVAYKNTGGDRHKSHLQDFKPSTCSNRHYDGEKRYHSYSEKPLIDF